jgi:hypothetical protein
MESMKISRTAIMDHRDLMTMIAVLFQHFISAPTQEESTLV